jgi:sugar phosphate isomerase/epimerase
MDYITYLRLLEEMLGLDGYLIIEHTPPEKLKAAVRHIRRWAEEAGL